MVAKQGLYANIAAKRARIAAGSGEKDAEGRSQRCTYCKRL
jgi:hypothetical protein